MGPSLFISASQDARKIVLCKMLYLISFGWLHRQITLIRLRSNLCRGNKNTQFLSDSEHRFDVMHCHDRDWQGALSAGLPCCCCSCCCPSPSATMSYDYRVEYHPYTSSESVPAQVQSPSNRAHNRQQSQNPRERGHASKTLPPIPIQDTNSSNGGPQLQYPQLLYPQETRGSYSIDKPQAHVGPSSIPSVQTYYTQIRPQTLQSRETGVSFSANKPWDSDHVECRVPIQEKS